MVVFPVIFFIHSLLDEADTVLYARLLNSIGNKVEIKSHKPKISEDLIGYTIFATSEERRIGFLTGCTTLVTSEQSRIDFSRHW